MYRTDADGNVNNLFDEGPPGTVVDASFLNAVQEELCHFIESMGITLDKNTRTQLTTAIMALLARLNTWTAKQTFAPTSGNTRAIDATGYGLAAGVLGTGGPGGDGVDGQGTGTGSGVSGVGGATNGTGVYGVGSGSGPGVRGDSASGPGLKGTGNATRAPLNLVPQAAPSTPADGDIWVETSTNTLKVRINGVTKTVTVT